MQCDLQRGFVEGKGGRDRGVVTIPQERMRSFSCVGCMARLLPASECKTTSVTLVDRESIALQLLCPQVPDRVLWLTLKGEVLDAKVTVVNKLGFFAEVPACSPPR